MKRNRELSRGGALVALIFGMMLLGILGVALSWEVYNTHVSSVDAIEMQQVYALAHSGIEFAIRYASDAPRRHRVLQSSGVTGTLPPSGSFPGGSFTAIYDPGTNTLTSTAALRGSTARRKLALMNFRDYVTPDWSEHFDEPPDQAFDGRYFATAGGWGAGTDVTQSRTVILHSVDDQSQPWLEQGFSLAGERNPDMVIPRASFFHLGTPAWTAFDEQQEYIMIIPTTPGTGRLRLRDSFDESGPLLGRTGVPVELDPEGYQNYSMEVKFSLSVAFPHADQGFGIVFRLHHPTKPLEGPWNKSDIDHTLAYVLQMEPALSRTPQGGFYVRWWAPDPGQGGRGTEQGLCGGEGLFFSEEYCKKQEQTPAGLVHVYKGSFFLPENPPETSDSPCITHSPTNPGWGWRDNGLVDNAWYDCNLDHVPDVHKLRVDVAKDTFTVYFGTEHGVSCAGDENDRFTMHKIIEINVGDERRRRGHCVPDYKVGHLGLRAWNGFQAQIDYIKVWAW